jgi:hypothetical protein
MAWNGQKVVIENGEILLDPATVVTGSDACL